MASIPTRKPWRSALRSPGPSGAAAAAAPASNGLTGGDTIIAGFAGIKTITTVADDTAREFRDDVNNVSSFTGVTAASRTNALLKTLKKKKYLRLYY